MWHLCVHIHNPWIYNYSTRRITIVKEHLTWEMAIDAWFLSSKHPTGYVGDPGAPGLPGPPGDMGMMGTPGLQGAPGRSIPGKYLQPVYYCLNVKNKKF